MAREFRLELKIALPEGDFDEAAALVALKPVVDAFSQSITDSMLPASLEYSVVTPKPRADKGDPVPQYAALAGNKVAA